MMDAFTVAHSAHEYGGEWLIRASCLWLRGKKASIHPIGYHMDLTARDAIGEEALAHVFCWNQKEVGRGTLCVDSRACMNVAIGILLPGSRARQTLSLFLQHPHIGRMV
jgi:hypothetical protein